MMPFRGEKEETSPLNRGEEVARAFVDEDANLVPIIESGPLQMLLVEGKAKGLHEVQDAPRRRGGPDDVARVLGDFWFEEDDVEHVHYGNKKMGDVEARG